MANQEIIDKLTGLVVFKTLRITGLVGEGKNAIVLGATDLSDGKKLVLKIDRSCPMFLLNEPDTQFLPLSPDEFVRADRYVTILEKLIAACETELPGLSFWHMAAIYERLLVALSLGHRELGMPVMDTTTSMFQNDELIRVGKQALARKAEMGMFELEYWEYYLHSEDLQAVLDFVSKFRFPRTLDFSHPVQLLPLVFSEGFFGSIPKEDAKQSTSFFGDLTQDSPEVVDAEHVLGEFLRVTEFASVVPDASDDLNALREALDQARTMLIEDALDKREQLNSLGEQFLMRYNAGRNTFLRGLPRFLRVANACLADA